MFGRSRSGLRGEGAASYCFGAGPWFQSSSARGPYPNEAVRTGSRIDAKKKRARARDASWKTLQIFVSGAYVVRGRAGTRGEDGWLAGVRRSSALLWFDGAASLLLRRGRTRLPHGCYRAAHSFRQPCDASTHFSSHL